MEPTPVDRDLGSKLSQCASATDPIACKYAIANAYFKANRYELAAPIFRDIAMTPHAGTPGIYAAQTLMECLNVLGSHAAPPRFACYDEMAAAVPRLKAVHCKAGPTNGPEDLCPLLDRLEVDMARRAAEQWVKQGDRREWFESPPFYARAAETYMGVVETYCRLDAAGKNTRGKVPQPTYACDELVYNAYRAYRMARDRPGARAARDAMLDPANKLVGSPLADRLVAEDPRW